MPSVPLGNEWTLVLKPSKKGENPPHLRKYQEKMRRIAPQCALLTEHLKGEKRVVALYNCIAQKMKESAIEEK